MIIRGVGPAWELRALIDGWRAGLDDLELIARDHPDARVVRNQVGNLSIILANSTEDLQVIGWIDTPTGTVNE